MNDIEVLTGQLEAANANNLLISERLQEEERKSEQLRQLVNQLKHQSKQNNNRPNNSVYDSQEAQIKQLQDELKSAKTNEENASLQSSPQHLSKSVFTSNNSIHSTSQLDLLKANEKFLKERVEGYKSELSKRDTEIQQFRTKLETYESKEKDLQHYLGLLKESILTKDQQISMQQAEITDCRNRIRDKDGFMEKKNQQLQAVQLEKHQRDSDIGELRDQMDIKERKISVLNRKVSD